LNSAPKTWINSFIESKGLENLFIAGEKLFNNSKFDSQQIQQMQYGWICCLEAFTNSEIGLELIYDDQLTLTKLSLYFMKSQFANVKCLILKLLSVFCLISESSSKILGIIDEIKQDDCDSFYVSIIDFMINEVDSNHRKIAMVFVNALINFSETLEIRSLVRRKFYEVGILKCIQKMKECDHDKKGHEKVMLLNQIDLFEQVAKSDAKETTMQNIDLSDPSSIFSYLKNQCLEDGNLQPFMQILQSLLFIQKGGDNQKVWCSLADFIGNLLIGFKNDSNFTYELLRIKMGSIKSSQIALNEELDRLREDLKSKEEYIIRLEKSNGDQANQIVKNPSPTDISIGNEQNCISEHQDSKTSEVSIPIAPPAPPVPTIISSNIPVAPPLPVKATNLEKIGSAPDGRTERVSIPRKHQIKLKPVYWSVIPSNQLDNTIWSELMDIDVEFAADDLAKSFCQKQIQKNVRAQAPEKKVSSITLIDGKRSYNVELCLAKFKIPFETIKEAILECNMNFLTEENIEQLLTVIPTPEEIQTINSYDGDISSLGKTEEFFIRMSRIPDLDRRLRFLFFHLNFENTYQEFSSKLDSVYDAFICLRKSKKIRGMLELILSIVNYLNYGTRFGDTYGFKISSLKTLSSTKSVENDSNLIDFIVKTAQNKFPDLIDVEDELKLMGVAMNIEENVLKSEISSVESNFRDMSSLLKDIQAYDNNDRLLSLISDFSSKHLNSITKLNEKLTLNTDKCSQLLNFYGDSSINGWENLFRIFFEFFSDWNKSKKSIQLNTRLQSQPEKISISQLQSDLINRVQDANRSKPKQNVGELFEQMIIADPAKIMEQLRERRKLRQTS
jgi:hypothetical protein